MKTVCGTDKCTGCMACLDICPNGAISLVDSLKSYNMVINEERCIRCNMCFNICQNNSKISFVQPQKWLEGWIEDTANREDSSSGGMAYAISRNFIEKTKGYVCSCVFKEGEFLFDIVNKTELLQKFKGSKYVKSNPIGIYKKIRDLLNIGNAVLFIGLPCQSAALKKFIGNKNNDKLYVIDLICHGTPSPKLLEIFFKEHGTKLKQLSSISFRKKNSYALRLGEKYVINKYASDTYSIAFLNGLIYTENCYACRYARMERVSDITLGDSWGTMLPNKEKRKGISLVLCQTNKGEKLLNIEDVLLSPTDKVRAMQYNHQLDAPTRKNKSYDYFFENIEKKPFDKLVKKTLLKQYYKQKVKSLLIRLHLKNK